MRATKAQRVDDKLLYYQRGVVYYQILHIFVAQLKVTHRTATAKQRLVSESS